MKLIVPKSGAVIVEGSMFYSSPDKCKSIIRLKKKLSNEFPELKSRDNVYYRIELWKTYDEVEDRIKDIVERRKTLPMLLFFYE
ncbi:MAG: hypothetical protein Q8O89_02470 [Nanoarchaeota archaeon]|nr:hypothetical protein [Nanoarchaeota archaeon]